MSFVDAALPGPTPDPNAPAPTVGPTDNIIGQLTTALRAAPELATSPGLAVPAAQSNDPAGTAQAIAHQTNTMALQRAVNRSPAHHSFWSDLGHGLGVVTHDVGSVLNKPLQIAQHEYRYLHDVEARHGVFAMLTELAPMVAVGAGAAVLAPFTGGASLAVGAGVLAGEAAGAGAGQVLYHDSWQRTADGTKYLDPHTGQPVSLGRDFASGVLGEKPGSSTFKWVSGIGDALGDLAMDPLARAGSAYSLAAKARFTVQNGADVERLAATSPRVQRAFDDMARSDAGTIMRNYPRLVAEQTPKVDPAGNVIGWTQSHDLAYRLGQASTRDEVTQVFKEYAEATNLTYMRLPTLHVSLTTVPVRALRDFLADAPITGRIMAGQQRLPTEFDPTTRSLTNTETDPMSPQFARNVYQWLRGNGQAESVARTVANNIINTEDVAQRIEIWKNSLMNSVVAQAQRVGMKPEDSAILLNPENQRKLGQEIEYLTSGIAPGRDSLYGIGPPGATRIAGVRTTEGTSLNAAILLSQTGKVSFPTMTEMRMAAARLAGGQDAIGTARGLVGTEAQRAMSFAKIDEWTAEHFTKNLFKTWVLLNAAFPLHVVLSEGALNSLRMGTHNLLRSKLAVTGARLADKYGGDDAIAEAVSSPPAQRSIAALAYHLLGKRLNDSDRADWVHNLIVHNTDNAVTPSALSADHSMPYAPEEHYASIMRNGIHVTQDRHATDQFVGLGAESRDQPLAWRTWLGQITKDPPSAEAARAYKEALDSGATPEAAHTAGAAAAKSWLDAHPEIHSAYHNARLVTPGWEHMSPLEAWSQKIMLNVRGATTGADNTIHHDLLDAITEGHFRPRGGTPLLPSNIDTDYLRAIDSKPAVTHGRLVEPDSTSVLSRIANIGYSKVVSPIINKWSREPIYAETSYRFWKQLEPAVLDGRITEEEAFVKANLWASHDMLRFVHNLHERTQLSETLRNVAPFWFAQQQAYKRVGRLLAENPGAFRKYQLMVTGMHDYSMNAKDAGGNNTIAFPGSGFLGSGVPGILAKIGLPMLATSPVSFSGSLDSLTFIMPGASGIPGTGGHPLMDFGPLVAIPVKAIAMVFPEFTPTATNVLGDVAMSQSIWKQLLPSATATRVIDALAANSRGFTSSMMATIQTLDYEQQRAEEAWVKGGRKGPEPQIVPGPDASAMVRQAFIDRVRNTTRINYLTKALLGFFSPLSPQLTINDFGFKKELNDAIKKEGSVSAGMDAFLKAHPDATPFTISESTNSVGFSLPASAQAENWINDHQDLVYSQPQAAFWLMPQLTDTTYSSSVYNEQLAQHIRQRRTPEEFLKAMYVASGDLQYYGQALPAYQQALKSGQFDPADLRAQFASWTQNFGLANPVWYDSFQSKTKADDRLLAIDQLNKILSSPNPPDSPQAAGLRGLLSDYATFNAAVASRVDTKANLSDQFQAYLISVAEDHPELKPFIVSVLGPVTSTQGASFNQAAQTAGLTTAA